MNIKLCITSTQLNNKHKQSFRCGSTLIPIAPVPPTEMRALKALQ